MLNTNLARALEYLKKGNFAAYITTLAALGVDISSELTIQSTKELAEKAAKNSIKKQLDIEMKHISAADRYNLRFTAALFAHQWHNEKQAKTQSAKYELNKSSRHAIHLGMLAVEEFLNQQKINPAEKIKNIENAEQKIFTAIKNYATPRQKIIRYLGKSLASVSSTVFGFETGIAVFFVGMLLFSPVTALALGSLLTTSLLFSSVIAYISYCTLKDDIPALLKEIAGKDKLLEGFLQYRDKEGKIIAFSNKQKAALAAFSLCFALPTAITTGAFGFTATLSLPTLLTILGISSATSLFPPIGIALAAIITLTMTLSIVKSFHTFIAYHNGNVLSFIRKPFEDVDAIINENINPFEHPIKNKLSRIAAHSVTALTCVMGLAGLGIASMGGVNSVTALVTRLFKSSLIISSAVGIAVGGILSFAARSFTTFGKCGGAIVNLFKLGFHSSTEKIDRFGLFTGIVLDLPLAAFFWIDAFLRPPATSLLPMPSTFKSAALATACTTVRDAGLVINSMFGEKNNGPLSAGESYQTKIKAQVLAGEKFVRKPASLQNFSFFKARPSDNVSAQVETHQKTPRCFV